MARAPAWIAMTAAQRMTKGLCPECGADLSEEDALHHRQLHWDQKLLNAAPDSQANVRAAMLDNWMKDQRSKAEAAKSEEK